MSEHPITPSSDLVRQWNEEALSIPDPLGWSIYIATQAANWGADQELEACVEWMRGSLTPFMPDRAADQLRVARRPKPLSKAESALEALEHILRHSQTDHGANTIRQALQSLKELEALPND